MYELAFRLLDWFNLSVALMAFAVGLKILNKDDFLLAFLLFLISASNIMCLM